MAKQKDDEQGPEIAPPAAPAAAPVKEEPSTPKPMPVFQVAEKQPVNLEEEGFKGRYYVHKTDPRKVRGQLKIDPNGHFGKTHTVKSQDHTWQGTEEQFRDQFEKE